MTRRAALAVRGQRGSQRGDGPELACPEDAALAVRYQRGSQLLRPAALAGLRRRQRWPSAASEDRNTGRASIERHYLAALAVRDQRGSQHRKRGPRTEIRIGQR
ncbi:hypothetical protein [Amycolatopsis sp. cmx-11-12]|uniref:hypothetical protein n=1 Tax=Amycolatopsis sp. cmx-11-12 TaxID=2785795 RepID=UPI0039180955